MRPTTLRFPSGLLPATDVSLDIGLVSIPKILVGLEGLASFNISASCCQTERRDYTNTT